MPAKASAYLKIRPFRWSRLLWTYLAPIIPLVLLFDGVVSCLRTYQPQELREIIEKLSVSEYQWQIGEHSEPSPQVPLDDRPTPLPAILETFAK